MGPSLAAGSPPYWGPERSKPALRRPTRVEAFFPARGTHPDCGLSRRHASPARGRARSKPRNGRPDRPRLFERDAVRFPSLTTKAFDLQLPCDDVLGTDGDPFRRRILPPGEIVFAFNPELRQVGPSGRDAYQQPRARRLSTEQEAELRRSAPRRTLRDLALIFGVSSETVRKTLHEGREDLVPTVS